MMKQQIQSTKTLVKATIISSMVAAVGLVLFILPAEYGIDPTGLGNALGLTQLAPNNQDSSEVVPTAPDTTQEDKVMVTVPARRGIEYKFEMLAGQKIKYQWQTNDGSTLYVDLHGEPRGDTTGFFESYAIAKTPEMSGTITVPFDGVHGWYWKNNTDQPIEVSLTTSGSYTVIGLLK